MSRILGPAIAAIGVQLAAVMVITVAFYLLTQRAEHLDPNWPALVCEAGTSCRSTTLLVRLSYLLTAFGAGFTNNRLVVRTTRWARYLGRATQHNRSRFLAKAVTLQLGIVIIAFVVEELDAPPEAVLAIGQQIYSGWIGAIIWPALWSIGIAGLGALFFALFKAMP